MAAPSFTVYTADQVKATPYRKSMPAYDEVHEADGVGARTLLKWTGIGIVAGLAVLTALIIVLNFGGDRSGLASASARSALVATTPAAAPVPAKAEAPKPTIELDAPIAPAAPAKKAPAKVAAKKKR